MNSNFASSLSYQRKMIAADRQVKRNKRKQTRNLLLFQRFLDEQGITIPPPGTGDPLPKNDR